MFHSPLTLLKEIFQKNGYPENFIDRCFYLLLNKIQILEEKIPMQRPQHWGGGGQGGPLPIILQRSHC